MFVLCSVYIRLISDTDGLKWKRKYKYKNYVYNVISRYLFHTHFELHSKFESIIVRLDIGFTASTPIRDLPYSIPEPK